MHVFWVILLVLCTYCSSKGEKTTLAKDDLDDTQAGGEFLTSKPRFKKDSVPKIGVTRSGRTTKKQRSSTVTVAHSLDEDHASSHLHEGSTQMHYFGREL